MPPNIQTDTPVEESIPESAEESSIIEEPQQEEGINETNQPEISHILSGIIDTVIEMNTQLPNIIQNKKKAKKHKIQGVIFGNKNQFVRVL
jgi:hypothetical protein